MAYSAPKNVVSLAEGMPNEETFPFTEISIKLNDGSSFTLDERELGAALQYIPTQGYPPLLQVTENSISPWVVICPASCKSHDYAILQTGKILIIANDSSRKYSSPPHPTPYFSYNYNLYTKDFRG